MPPTTKEPGYLARRYGRTYVVEKRAVLGRPADLHNARSDDQCLVVPRAAVHLECAANTLEAVRVTASLHSITRLLQLNNIHAHHCTRAEQHSCTRALKYSCTLLYW